MFALRATYHTTLQATLAQLVFGRDAVLNTKFETDWKLMKERKQKLISYNNQQEINHIRNTTTKLMIKYYMIKQKG
jgi:hypothetical protein